MVNGIKAAGQGDFAKAEKEYRSAIRAFEGSTANEARLATALLRLAQLYKNRGDYANAEPVYLRALSIREGLQSPNAASVSLTLDEIAQLYEAQHKYEDAIRIRNRALAIWEKLLAYPTVAMELQSLARDDFARKNYASASAFNQRAIGFQEVFAGRYPGLLISSLRYQARVLRELHLDPEAIAMDDRANKISEINHLFQTGGSVVAPKVLRKTDPAYTPQARKAGVEGAVVLYLEVTAEGRADNILTLRGIGFGLDEKAVEAVGTWQFQPAMKDGNPVKTSAIVEVNFGLF